MKAIHIVMKRTGLVEDDASYYVCLAESRVRLFLELTPLADLSQYMFEIADIATLMYQMDASVKQTEDSLGYKSKSFSEGGVSVSSSGLTGSEIRQSYDDEIQEILNRLKGTEVVFL